jgi:hypothetical protein
MSMDTNDFHRRAETVYTIEEGIEGRAHYLVRSLGTLLLGGVFGTAAPIRRTVLKVVDRSSRKVLFRENRIEYESEFDERQKLISSDLANLSVDAFRKKYR